MERLSESQKLNQRGDLHRKYTILLLVIDLTLRPTVGFAPAHTPFTTFYSLETGLMALEDFKSTRQHDDSLMSGRFFEKPTDHSTLQKDYMDEPR